MDWLKADGINEKISGGTGLLLAPMNPDTKKFDEEIQPQELEIKSAVGLRLEPSIEDFMLRDSESENDNEDSEKNFEESELEVKNETVANEADEPENVKSELETKIKELEKFSEKISNKLSEIDRSVPSSIDKADDKNEEINEDEDKKILDEQATGFELNLNEPPPEIWTRINAEYHEDDNNEEDEELDYEQGMSLQGAAYIPKAPKDAPGRGINFTERLHRTLRGRKQKAEQLREQEEEKKPQHPYLSRALIICSTLLMLLGVAYLALWFIRQWTPEKIHERANSRLQIGDYEGAMDLFQRGYKRYPKNLAFLTGLAKAAESADHTQTAITAWEAYINSLPKNDNENKNLAQIELRRIKGEPEPQPEPEKILEPPPPPVVEIIKEPEPEVKEVIEEKKNIEPQEPKLPPAAFYEFLNEANEAYNSKLYDTAIIYFYRAMELNTSDIRTYIGLAQAFQAKKMFFDAKRILDEARRRFKDNLTIETQLKILEEE